MSIPEINENQLKILEIAGKMNEITTFWMLPDLVNDNSDDFFKLRKTQEDLDGLIALQLLVDSTKAEENSLQIKAIEEANKRPVRATSITNYGMALFGEVFQMSKRIN